MSNFKEHEHPRAPKGSERGGEFIAKGVAEKIAANTPSEEDIWIEKFLNDESIDPTVDTDEEEAASTAVEKYAYFENDPVPDDPKIYKTWADARKTRLEEKSALRFYTADGSFFINEHLRSKKYYDGFPKKDLESASEKLSSFLSKAPKYQGTSYRGMKGVPPHLWSNMLAMNEGAVFSDKGFVSSSFSPSNLEYFSKTVDAPNSVLLKIKGKSGVAVAKVSAGAEGEREVLFNKGTKFKVNKKKFRSNGRQNVLFFELEEM